LGYAACQQELRVAYRNASHLFQDLSGGHADGTFKRRVRYYLALDWLIVDDFGLRELSVQVAEDFFARVRQREQQGSWLIASNRQPADWYGLFANPVVAEGVLDRLINSSYHLVLEGRSYRPMHRPTTPATE
jgi:DNA replication protein DnaC